MDMDHGSVTPTRVLKAIRDGSAVDHDTIDRELAGCDGDRFLIRRAIGDLQDAGLIQFDSGRCTVTEHWMKLQGLLELASKR
jgi:hypothetical protein